MTKNKFLKRCVYTLSGVFPLEGIFFFAKTIIKNLINFYIQFICGINIIQYKNISKIELKIRILIKKTIQSAGETSG